MAALRAADLLDLDAFRRCHARYSALPPHGGLPQSAAASLSTPVRRARNADQIALRRIRRLANRLRHFACLAVAVTDAALLVADDDERREAEAPAALHHLRHTVDVDELVDELARLVALAGAGAFALVWFTCHLSSSSKLQTCFARRVGQRLDATVIEITAAIEHHVLDALLGRALGDEPADRLGGIDVGARLATFAQRLFH